MPYFCLPVINFVTNKVLMHMLSLVGSLCLHLGGLETWAEEWGPGNE